MNNRSGLSKQERRELRRQRRRERKEWQQSERKRGKRNRILKTLIPVLIIIGAIGLLASWWLGEGPAIQVMPDYYDFGDVSVFGGIVTTQMTVTNRGQADLVISGMDSSCGCTSASLIADGKEGPKFSMAGHGTNPTGWSVTLEPGQSAQLKIYYDPAVHRDMRGPVTRTVSIYSNDPINSKKDVRIDVNQV